MKKIIIVVLLAYTSVSYACSDIFINQGLYKIEARSMDFPLNMGFNTGLGFVGQENTANPVIDRDLIPNNQLTKWNNKYGFVGRTAFDTPNIVDGMNSEGFSIAMLYLPGSEFPTYNEKDKRKVIAGINLGSYLLSQAKNVKEALKLVDAHQIVKWAVETKKGVFLSDIDVHMVLRDKKGDSAVIEFIKGKIVIYKNAGNVLTNEPSYDWQLDHAKHYKSLNVSAEEENKLIKDSVYDYSEIYHKSLRAPIKNLLGLPGDFTPASRFVRATVLLNNMATPKSTAEAIYQANMILNSVVVPYMTGNTLSTETTTSTLWKVIKDLNNLTIRYHNIAYYQADNRLLPMDDNSGYKIDLKSINFKSIPDDYIAAVLKPESTKDIKIVSAKKIKGF